jgi:magnesium-transporting ATPase (P-type)
MSCSPPADGLCGSQTDHCSRRKADGYNELTRANQRTVLRIALEIFREPMFALLVGSGAIYLVLGDLGKALLLLAFATISVGIAIVQESRSENVLNALRDLPSPRTLSEGDRSRRTASCSPTSTLRPCTSIVGTRSVVVPGAARCGLVRARGAK